MDTAAHQNFLPGLRERLMATASKTKPTKIDKLEGRLHELSERYAQVMTEYRVHGQRALSNPYGKLSAEGLLVEAEKTKLEKERDDLRVKLRDARAAWLPQLSAATAPLMTEANEALHQALALIEAAQVVHEARDLFFSTNGHSSATTQMRGRLLESYAQNIRRFLERSK